MVLERLSRSGTGNILENGRFRFGVYLTLPIVIASDINGEESETIINFF